MRRIPARRAALLAATLALASVAPGLAPAARADEPTFKVTAVVRDASGTPIEMEDEFVTDSDGRQFWLGEVPAGRYTFHFRAVTDTYRGGFDSGDDGAPGLFVDGPLEVSGDTTVDWTVPVVDFPVHVEGRDGSPAGGYFLSGESNSSFEVAPGVVATGQLRNALKARTDEAGDGKILVFAGSAPATVAAGTENETHGRVFPAPSDTSAVVVLDNPRLEGEVFDARGPLQSPAADHVTVSFSGNTFEPTGTSFVLQDDPGDYQLSVGNGPIDDYDDEARPATATLPGLWSFWAPYHHIADATVNLTLPDAAPADIVVLGADDQPLTGVAMEYEARSDDTFELAPGIHAQAAARDTISDTAGHFAPMLFGPSSLTFSVGDTPGGPVTISPGEHVTVRLNDRTGLPSAPQNVTATAGDGKVKVTWEPPAFDGASPITGYTITASRNASNTKAHFGADATSGAIRTLINGKTYTITVTAKNANGAGLASAPLTVSLPEDEPTTTTTTRPAPGDGSGGNPLGGAGTVGDTTGEPAGGSGRSGYWLLGADGAVYPFGDAAPYGDAAAALAAAASAGNRVRALDIEPTPSGQGYWVLDSQGRVRPFGDAGHLGDVPLQKLSPGEEPASISTTPTGAGYWVFTSRGRALPFGDAVFLGDVSDVTLNGPVLDSIATPSGKGYYMVAGDGGIFAFGDARFIGSMGDTKLNAPVRSLVPDGDGRGYWLVASDGGVFAFDAPFRGSLGGVKLNKPVRGMVRYGDGYLMVGEDGGIFDFSDRPFSGSLGARPPASPIISVGAL